MSHHDFIIINKSDLTEPFIFVNKESYIDNNKKWFLNFLNSKKQSLYINFRNLDLKINKYTQKQIVNQFKVDAKRTFFSINSQKFTELPDIIEKLQSYFNCDLQKYLNVLFLCSQTSLAFILLKLHLSLLEEEIFSKNRELKYYIAELSNSKNKNKNRKMKINVLLQNKAVIIDKYLRIVKYGNNDNMFTVQKFKLTLYFTIQQNDQINCLASFIKCN
mgnify:CR=1 FL=1